MTTVVPSPGRPVAPVSPVFPVLPVLPVFPVFPVFPVAPGWPGSPTGPGAPAGPGTTTTGVGGGTSFFWQADKLTNRLAAASDARVKRVFMELLSGEGR